MPRPEREQPAILVELARRGVLQSVGVYLVAAWAVVEMASTILPYFGIGDGAVRAVIVLAALGAPVVGASAWIFQVTPEGIEREDGSTEDATEPEVLIRVGWGRLPVAVAGVVVAVSLGLVAAARLLEPPTLRSDVVAVFPFTVRGDQQRVGHLGEGMVTLLSRQLDGVADLRAADPGTVLSVVGDSGAGPLGQTAAREIAARLGAGYFVLGAVTEVGGRVDLSARMYGPDPEDEPATASIEGGVELVFDLAEDLIVQLLVQQMGAVSRYVTGTAARDTESLVAFKAFVDAERELRRNRRSLAIAGFQAAVAEDSAFALAHYRLAIAAGLARNYRLVDASLDQARAHADRLNERGRRLLEALATYRSGRIDLAEERYRALLEDYPDLWEAHFLLGELLARHNPARGRSAREALPFLEAVARADPSFGCPRCTLGNFALVDGDIRRSDSIHYAQVPKEQFRVYAAASAQARRDSVEFAELYRPGMDFPWQASWLAAWFLDYEGAARLVRPSTGADRDDRTRLLAALLLADMDVARGRWEAIPPHLALARSVSPGRTLLRRAFFLTQPLADPSEQEFDRVIGELERWIPVSDGDPLLGGPLDPLLPQARASLLGLLRAIRGDATEASAWADSLEAMSDPEDVVALSGDLARIVRAEVALGDGRHGEVLELLDAIRAQIPVPVMDHNSAGGARLEFSDLFTLEHARLSRIRALIELGRMEEARRWLENGFFRIGGNPLLAPTLQLLRGRVYEALGEVAEARRGYASFLEVWEGTGPRLGRHAEEARARLAVLGGA